MAAAEGGERSLEGRVALVTGASRGLGFAAAQALVEAGARVAMLARGEGPLREAAARLGALGASSGPADPGGAALALPADVADPASVEAAFARVQGAFGRLDVLVNNAGIGSLHRIESVPDAALRAQLHTNVLGTIVCTRAAIPALRASGGGDIVNVSSDSVVDPVPFLSIYAATKGAIEVFTRALRREVAGDGIRVALVRPGPTVTTFASSWDSDTFAEARRVWAEGGYGGAHGVLDPAVVGRAIVHVVTRPKQACVDVLEIRPSGG